MIKHIVLFKITDAGNNDDRLNKALKMKSVFEKLIEKIDVIRSYEVGINKGDSDSAYDLVINSSFDTWSDLDEYINHPAHQEAIRLNKNIQKVKAVVDYEI